MTTINALMRNALGLQPDSPLSSAVFTAANQFIVTIDLRPVLRTLGGDWAILVDRVEEAAAVRQQNLNAHLAGAGIQIGKE